LKSFLLFVISVLLVSCVPGYRPIPAVKRIPFPETEYQSLTQTGNATIRGQAFLKTRGGDVKTGAGNIVTLEPVTSYSLQGHNQSCTTGRRIDAPDPRALAYVREQTADGNGRFTFKNVPPGDYFVTTEVTWEASNGVQGGTVTERVKVNAYEELDVVVTHQCAHKQAVARRKK